VPAWAKDWKSEIGKELSVSGTWWIGGGAAERNKFWKASVISYEARHRFANKTAPGLQLTFPDYVVDEDTEREFWFEIETGGSKSYAVLKAAHDERERVRSVRAQALELANAAADANRSGNEQAEGDESAGGAEADDEADNPSETATRRYKSVIHPFFEVHSGPFSCRSATSQGGASTKYHYFKMKCLLKGASKYNDGVVNQQSLIPAAGEPEATRPKSTGKMSGFLLKFFKEIYEEFVQGKSPYSRVKRGSDGRLIKKLPLRQNWKKAVKYVEAAAHDMRPVTWGRSERMKDFLEELDEQFNVPVPATARKIAAACVVFDDECKARLIETKKSECMEGMTCTTEDSWTDGKGKAHFSSLSSHFVVRTKEKMTVDVHSLSKDDIREGRASVDQGEKLTLAVNSIVLDFSISNATDKADDVAEGYESKLRENHLSLKNVALATLDGAAVGVAAKRSQQFEIEAWKVCDPHNVARSAAAGFGTGNKISQNPEGKVVLRRNRRISGFFHRSTDKTKKLMAKQRTLMGIPAGRELGAAVGNVSRWGADKCTIERNNELQPAVDGVLDDATVALRAKRRQAAAAEPPAGEAVAAAAVSSRFNIFEEDGREETESDDDEVSEDDATEGPAPAPGTTTVQTPRTPKIPLTFTLPQWRENCQLEAACTPLMTLTLQTEGDVPVADMAPLYVRRCIRVLESDKVSVPVLNSGLGKARKFHTVKWDDCAESVQTFRTVVLSELKERFINHTPDKTTLVLMMLNPYIHVDKVLPEAQYRAAVVAFNSTWDAAAALHASRQPAPAPPSPNTRRVHPRREAATGTAATDDADDEPDEYCGAGVGVTAVTATPVHDAAKEKADYLALEAKPDSYTKFLITDGIRKKRLDMFLMFADPEIRDKYPIATIIFESKGCAQVTEAHEERVFRFAKLTKNPLRTRLSPMMLAAFVIIRHNFPVWRKLYGIDYDRLFEIFKTVKNNTGEHENNGATTEEDDIESDVEEGSDEGDAEVP